MVELSDFFVFCVGFVMISCSCVTCAGGTTLVVIISSGWSSMISTASFYNTIRKITS